MRGNKKFSEKIIILGAGPLQAPALKIAKEMGLYVIAFDQDDNAKGIPYADEFYKISTTDIEAVYAKSQELMPDYVITSTSDAPVRTAAYVCEKMGLPYGLAYEDAICATVKSEMRKRLGGSNVPIPQYFICHNFDEVLQASNQIRGMCIIKPSDNAASRGVRTLDCNLGLNEIRSEYDYCLSNSKNGIVLVEEYMQGPEVSVECFVVKKSVHVIVITDKVVSPLPYFVELGHSEPSLLDGDLQREVRKAAVKAVGAIGIVDGVAHVEIKCTKEGPKIVELAARLGGDYITSKLVPLSTGVEMVSNSIKLAIGREIDIEAKKSRGCAVRFISCGPGIIKKIEIPRSLSEAEGVEEIVTYVAPGSKVQGLRSSNDRIGHVITCCDSVEEAIHLADEIVRSIRVEVVQNESRKV